MEEAPPARRPDPLSWAVFAVLAAVYRWGRCPSYGPGESIRVVARLSPLFAGWPLDTPAGWANSLSGLCHAAAAALLFALLRRLGLRRAPALAAAALVAFLHQYWYYALVAGHASAAVCGLALAVWSVVAWKEDARARPLLLGALGAAAFVHAAPRAASLVPAAQWVAALLAGLLFSRLDLVQPNAAAGVLVGVLLLGLARPYDLRAHNPTQEWARAALESAEGADCLVTQDSDLAAAIVFESKSVDRVIAVGPDLCKNAVYDPLFLPHCPVIPRGILFEVCEPPQKQWDEDRIRKTLSMPALTSIGRRDRAKYAFAGEDGLYERYARVLRRERDLLPAGETTLRARIAAQLADYEPPAR